MLQCRLEPLEGALVVPKRRKFERTALIDGLLQPATSAIRAAKSGRERVVSCILARWETAKFGAVVWVLGALQ